jgi:transposase
MTKLNASTKAMILELANNGTSIREIAARLALKRSRVGSVCKQKSPDAKMNRGGRPAKLSLSDKRYCVRSICRDPKANATTVARSLREQFDIVVTPQTVRRNLRAQGMAAVEKTKKPILTRAQVKNRLQFAKAHQFWTKADWRRVIWTDETKINRFISDGRAWAWIRDTEELQPRQVKMTVKHGGGHIMIWGCIMAQGPGYICRIEGNMDQTMYKEILSTHLMNSMGWYRLNRRRVIFQHDNDPKHTAKSVQEWLSDQQFEILPWPAQSPDLNPIEHMWASLKRRLSEYESAPTGILELWERVEEVWNKFTSQDCLKLIDSMPDRIQAVLKAKGRWTDY